MKVPIDRIIPNPEQPRIHFSQAELNDLAQSIRINGLLQPVVVEDGPDGYILIDGERRWRACRQLGLTEIEAAVRPGCNGAGQVERAILALVANIQRADLNPVEEARGYARLRELGLSNVAIARRLGTNATRIANRLALLEVDEAIQDLFAAGALPIDQRVVAAIQSVPEEHQVEFARRLARPGVRIKTVQTAAEKLNHALSAARIQDDPGIHLAVRKAGRPVLPEWDALHQLGQLPPWPAVQASARHTCATCELRNEASVVICGHCPLVVMLAQMIKVANGHRHQRTH